jgi:hypothetical protein
LKLKEENGRILIVGITSKPTQPLYDENIGEFVRCKCTGLFISPKNLFSFNYLFRPM